MRKFRQRARPGILALLLAGCGTSRDPQPDPASGGSGGENGGASSGGSGMAGSGGIAAGGATTGGSGGTAQAGGTDPGGSGGMGVFVGDLNLPVSPFVVVDQFGYLPEAEKLAVIRDPQEGFDANESFTAGPSYALVNASTGYAVLTAAPTAWQDGATDPASGDRVQWFNFTSVSTPGSYFVMDLQNEVRSHVFDIADDVYRVVLDHALRMFFYQRSGQEKTAVHAGEGWADAASFVGPGQDHDCRLFSDPGNAATERDLWGGWYDAGDLNKYTIWTAGYVQNLLRAFSENSAVWSDEINIPESGNGIPDIVDEAAWGLSFLSRLQQDDGSVLSIVGEAGGSPPSAVTDPCRYGPATTSASLATAAAFATAARVLPTLGSAELNALASDVLQRAEHAWAWAAANPSVIFRNNEGDAAGLGAGQQETDDYGRLVHKLDAAAQLFSVTGEQEYRSFFDANYQQLNLFAAGNSVEPWHILGQDAALDYTKAEGATAATTNAIRAAYLAGITSSANLGAIAQDPYKSPLPAYVWGSNVIKSHMGNNFFNVITFGLDAASDEEMKRAAEGYVHYLHGLNALSLVYLTNMADYGAEHSANEIYHDWFKDGSALWDRVGVSTYGPPPGFMPGGPNPYYECGLADDPACAPALLTPPLGQPPQKSYKDFNAGWPEGSWSVTEPSNGYQTAYLRLLSKFVR